MMKGGETNWQKKGKEKVPFVANRGQYHSVAGLQRRWGGGSGGGDNSSERYG